MELIKSAIVLQRRLRHHRDLEAFLCLPVKEENEDYLITAGWRYPDEVKQETGVNLSHGAIDYQLPKGTKVRAPVSGWAMATYYSYPLEVGGEIKGMGMGYFAQIYDPESKSFVQLAHLDTIADKLAFFEPDNRDGIWWPRGHDYTAEQIEVGMFALMTEVGVGDVVGTVGNSGLWLGEADYSPGGHLVSSDWPSWDEPHIHMVVFVDRSPTGEKRGIWDPYGIYAGREDYPTPIDPGKKVNMFRPSFLLDGREMPRFC